jgi:hypothetical protein
MQILKGKSKYFVGFCLLIAAFALGVVVGKLFNISYFKVDENINIIDVISVAVTIFAAYIVTKVLDKEKQDNRTEKDLIIKRTEDIYQLIDDSNNKVNTGAINYQEAASHFKRINVSLNCIYRILTNTKIGLDETHKKNIIGNTKKLRDLLTDTPKISEAEIQISNLPNEVKDSIVHLTQNRILEIETEYDKLRDNILLLQLAINKA